MAVYLTKVWGSANLAARFNLAWKAGETAHAVDHDRPFLSETGYHSFLGIHADPVPALLPDEFAGKIIAAYVARERKGWLASIKACYREKGAR